MRSRKWLVFILPWCLVFIVDCSGAIGSRHQPRSGYVKCLVKALSTSPYVEAYFWGLSSVAAGANETASNCNRINERHIVNLLSSAAINTESSSPTHISLHVSPNNVTELTVGGALVFVLASPRTVVWHFFPELIGNKFFFQFWVSKGSYVFGDGVSDMAVHRVPSKRLETLVRWAENTLGPITLYTEIPDANHNITHVVEIGVHVDKQDICPIMFQPAKGCVATSNKGISNRDLHIIEVVDAGSLDGAVIELIVRPTGVRRIRRNLMIVLRSHCSVFWVIETRNLRGNIDIVTDDTLNITQVDVQSVRVISERLNRLGGQRLVDWTTDKYGPPVSYTYIPLADKLELIVDEHDYFRQSGNTFHQSRVRYQNRNVTSQSVRRTIKKTKPINEQDELKDILQQRNNNSLLAAEESVPCESILIPKSGVGVFSVMAIAFAAFIIGCLLIGVLWFIHTQTVSKRRRKRSSENVKTKTNALIQSVLS